MITNIAIARFFEAMKNEAPTVMGQLPPPPFIETTFIPKLSEVHQISLGEFIKLNPGDVVLAKSPGVPELGVHYFIITGPVIKKPHGYRPEGVTVTISNQAALYANEWLIERHDEWPMDGEDPAIGYVILQLSPIAADDFLSLNSISIEGKNVVLPNEYLVSSK